MTLTGKNILIGITGGIAAYKICELIRMFKKKNANIKVCATQSALEFVTPLTLETLSKEPVYVQQFSNEDKKPEHIALCDWADVFLIAPASANTIGKIANGICDNLLTSLACAFTKKIIMAPAMNTGMWNNKAVQKNIETLKNYGVDFVEPEEGWLACGTSGQGRLADIKKICAAVCCALDLQMPDSNTDASHDFSGSIYQFNNGSKSADYAKFLKGKKVVITAGGTKENFDPVRYIGNYSSGKMGTAIADKAFEAGAEVCLIKTFPLSGKNYKTIDVNSAAEMFEQVKNNFESTDILIMTAAVADYRPEQEAFSKIKKDSKDEIILKLVKNPDILSEMCKIKKDGQIVIGFCAESDNLIENAKEKIKKKNCDFLVANDISRKDTGFSSDFNEVFILDRGLNIQKFDRDTKENIAQKLMEFLWQKQAI